MSTTVIAMIYFLLLGINYFVFKSQLKYEREWSKNKVNLIRKVDLWEQQKMLQELHDIQENCPFISEHDTAMQNRINEFIANTAQQLRYLDNKKEPSENGDNGTDNSK